MKFKYLLVKRKEGGVFNRMCFTMQYTKTQTSPYSINLVLNDNIMSNDSIIWQYFEICMYKFTHMVEDSMDRTTATNWEHSVYESIKKNQ